MCLKSHGLSEHELHIYVFRMLRRVPASHLLRHRNLSEPVDEEYSLPRLLIVQLSPACRPVISLALAELLRQVSHSSDGQENPAIILVLTLDPDDDPRRTVQIVWIKGAPIDPRHTTKRVRDGDGLTERATLDLVIGDVESAFCCCHA